MPVSKSAYDRIGNPAAYFFARPASYPITLLCVNAGVGANTVSWLATLVALAACAAAVVMPDAWLVTSLVIVWLVLDCVDGNIARVTRSGSKYGEFLDALSGYLLSSLLPVCLAVGLPSHVALMGGVAGVLALLPRLLLNKSNVLSGGSRNSSGDMGGGRASAWMLSIYNLSGLGIVLLFLALQLDCVGGYLAMQCFLGAGATAAAIRKSKGELAS